MEHSGSQQSSQGRRHAEHGPRGLCLCHLPHRIQAASGGSPRCCSVAWGAVQHLRRLARLGHGWGIIVAWDSMVVTVPAFRVDLFSVTIELAFEGGLQWTLTTVYGPTDDQLKVHFLDELRNVRAACLGPWAVAGDFNLIVEAFDKNNDMLNRRMMGHFHRLLNDLELKKSSLIGRRYTWSNERRSLKMEKIDRWFCSVDWDAGHHDHLLQALSSLISDHCPILMSTNILFHHKLRSHFQSY